MNDIRDQLAGHLYHSALELDPLGAVALRIGHDAGLVWEIADDTLTVTVAGQDPVAFDLAPSLADLVDALVDAGIAIRYANPDFAGRSAACLVPGHGDGAGNDRLLAYQSNLWALLDAYGVEVRGAQANLVEAIDQLILTTSDGQFLDFWGSFFAVARLGAESDDAYRVRMVEEVLRPRNNAYAIQNAVRDLTGLGVTLREPWREIFTLDVSELSGGDHFQDGSFYTWNVFQPIYHSALTPAERDQVIAIIERNRPAGCLMIGEYAQPAIFYGDFDLSLSGSMSQVHFYADGNMNFQNNALSSSMALSDARPDAGSVFQWTLAGEVTQDLGTGTGMNLIRSVLWGNRLWDSQQWLESSVLLKITQTEA